MFRIRWRITIYLLELGLRIVVLGALFARSELRRPRVLAESRPNHEKIGV